MPYTARIAGLLQHVIVRSIERRDIFFDDNDRRLFLERLSKLLAETGTDCLSWALMSNHFHLNVYETGAELSKDMTYWFNWYNVSHNMSAKTLMQVN